MRKHFALALVSTVVLAAAAFAGTAMAEDLTIGYSQYAAYNNWRVTNTDDINRALEAEGWKVIFADANDDTAQQIIAGDAEMVSKQIKV